MKEANIGETRDHNQVETATLFSAAFELSRCVSGDIQENSRGSLSSDVCVAARSPSKHRDAAHVGASIKGAEHL